MQAVWQFFRQERTWIMVPFIAVLFAVGVLVFIRSQDTARPYEYSVYE